MLSHQNDIDEFHKLGSTDAGIKDVLQITAPSIILLIAEQLFDIDLDT